MDYLRRFLLSLLITALPTAAASANEFQNMNQWLADAFTRLTHDMEWGASKPHLVRYESPVRVAIEGAEASTYSPDLEQLLETVRAETQIDIQMSAPTSEETNIHIRFVGPEFNRMLPSVSCLVAGGNIQWPLFKSNPGKFGGRALLQLRKLEHTTIFIPNNARPYLVRSCLAEEVLQALGTANDLYDLPHSIFNDNGIYTQPTDFDFLMLRVLYDHELQNDMDRATTRERALAVLDRIHPQGMYLAPFPAIKQKEVTQWRKVTQKVFSRATKREDAIEFAETAMTMVEENNFGKPFECYSKMTLGRVYFSQDPHAALEQLTDAKFVCGSLDSADSPGLYGAIASLYRGVALVMLKRTDEAIRELETAISVFEAADDYRLSDAYFHLTIAWYQIKDMPDFDWVKASEARDRALKLAAFSHGEARVEKLSSSRAFQELAENNLKMAASE